MEIFETELNNRTSKTDGLSFSAFHSYQLVVGLNESLEKEIISLRAGFANEYGVKADMDIPGIVIASFSAKEMMEERLINWVQRICSMLPSFELVLNNFGGYPQKTIFLRVQNSEWFVRMAQQLKIVDEYLQSNECPPARLFKKPLLTIADDLSPEIYERAIASYSRQCFTATCVAGKISMLRRTDIGENVKAANNFYLQPL
jgi:hypothetical protein